jgi:hypothetical protein
LKFYRHLEEEVSRFFIIKNKGFNYNKEKTARFFFVVKSKGEIILTGPKLEKDSNVIMFRKKHENVFTKSGRIYARENLNFNIKKFIEMWKKKNSEKIKEMYINELRVVD